MKLDVTCMRYLTKDDFRVLVAVEMGMRNHLDKTRTLGGSVKVLHRGLAKNIGRRAWQGTETSQCKIINKIYWDNFKYKEEQDVYLSA